MLNGSGGPEPAGFHSAFSIQYAAFAFMGVIKASNVPVGVAPFSMRDIENHAKSILLRARQQADQLLAEAQAEAEELKRAARAEGLAEGRAEGMAQGRAEGTKAAQQQALAENRAQLQAALAA